MLSRFSARGLFCSSVVLASSKRVFGDILAVFRRSMCPARITPKSKTTPGYRPTSFSVNFVGDPPRLNKHVMAVEAGKPVADLITENLAAAIRASLFRMPEVTKESAAADLSLLHAWANYEGRIERQDARDALFESIKHRLGPLIDSKLEILTFFTNGTPYGVYPFACPTTHFFIYRWRVSVSSQE
jgi:hypothetical protein